MPLGKGLPRMHFGTPRLRVATPRGTEVAEVRSLIQEPDIAAEFGLYGQLPPPPMLHLAEFPHHLAIELRETGELVGFLGLVPCETCPGWIDLRYAVRPAHRRRGIATEALHAVLPRLAAQDPELEGVMAMILCHNAPSLSIARGLGLRPVPWPNMKAGSVTLAADRAAMLRA